MVEPPAPGSVPRPCAIHAAAASRPRARPRLMSGPAPASPTDPHPAAAAASDTISKSPFHRRRTIGRTSGVGGCAVHPTIGVPEDRVERYSETSSSPAGAGAASLARGLLYCPPEPWPDGPGAMQEVGAPLRVSGEERPGRLATLRGVAAPAARDQVAIRVVAALDPRLHVVQRQIRGRERLAAVNAAMAVPAQDPLAAAPTFLSVHSRHRSDTRFGRRCSRPTARRYVALARLPAGAPRDTLDRHDG